MREVTRFEAWWRRTFDGARLPDPPESEVPDDAVDALLDDARAKVRRCFAGFLGPVVRAGVPFAATYGNHDFQCGILAGEQDGIYREFPGCLNPRDPGSTARTVTTRSSASPARSRCPSRRPTGRAAWP